MLGNIAKQPVSSRLSVEASASSWSNHGQTLDYLFECPYPGKKIKQCYDYDDSATMCNEKAIDR